MIGNHTLDTLSTELTLMKFRRRIMRFAKTGSSDDANLWQRNGTPPLDLVLLFLRPDYRRGSLMHSEVTKRALSSRKVVTVTTRPSHVVNLTKWE